MQAQFSQKMSGDRKAIMAAIAAATNTEAKYKGAPSFAYEAGGWYIDREGVLTSPVFGMDTSGPSANADLMATLGERDFAAEGALTAAIFPSEYDPAHLENIRAILTGKATLIRHALGIEVAPDAALAGDYGLEDGFVFPFYPAALTHEAVLAALQFSERVYSQAVTQGRVRTRDTPVENEKYAMRCFLLRIGMIGNTYAGTRKELLRRLPGNSSFKAGGPKQAGEAQTPATGLNSLGETLADAVLIHEVNALSDSEAPADE